MLSETRHLEIQVTDKTCTIVDTTDYASLTGLNLATAGAKLIGTITGPDGIPFVTGTVGSPLIDLAGGSTESDPFDLPLDDNGEILNGTYSFTCQLYLAMTNAQFLSITPPNTIVTDGDLWLFDILIAGDTLDLVGGTDQTVTVASTADSDPNVTITTSTTILSAVHDSYGNIYHNSGSETFTYNGCDVITPTVNITANCFSTQFGQLILEDTTTLPSTQVLGSRAWSIEYPSNLSPAPTTNPITATAASVTVPTLATGPWGYRLTYSDVTVTQTDGLVYVYTSTTGSLNYTVTCSNNLCSIMTCYSELVALERQDIVATGSSALTPTLNILSRYAVVAQGQQQCGDQEGLAATIALMETLIESTGQCSCGCNENTGNVWINNAGFDAQTMLEQIVSTIQYRLFNGIPGANQDSTIGATVGSVYQNYNTQIEYICTDATAGAAVWEVYYDPSNVNQYVLFNGVPGVNQDDTLGVTIGTVYQNYNTGIEYRCTDATLGAAVWEVYYDPSIPALTVYDDLVAQGVDETTTAIAEYGVNVFRTITGSDYCAKLPQPVTGQSTYIVNMTTLALVLYPSNMGGQINNLPVDVPVTIPPDGQPHLFICIENPLPGAWTWTTPATGQYDSGVITSNTSGGSNVIMAANDANQIERIGYYSASSWAYDGKNAPLIQKIAATYVCFKPTSAWLGITKVKVYTNLSATGASVEFALTAGMLQNNYDSSTGDFVSAGTGGGGNYGGSGVFFGNCGQEITGGSIPFGTLTTNVGDAGTCFGEMTLIGGMLANYGSIIGDVFQQVIVNPNPPNQNLDQYQCGYIAFAIRSNQVLAGFKFQFFIEYI